MADFGHPRKRKRNHFFSQKKLSKGDKVEVRSLEDGFLGSWHAGVIIESRSGVRIVKYEHLLCDDGSGNLTESVEVSSMVDGISSSSETANFFRGRIRPSPPARELEREEICYGLCVDAYYNEAWWEGVIFDCKDGSENRKVFFPDLGDELDVQIGDLRITHDWDEVTAEWKPRGNWLFLEIIEENVMDNIIPVSIKQIWYDLRERKEYHQIVDWTSPMNPLWQSLVEGIINDHLSLTVDEFMSTYDFSEAMLENCKQICLQDSALIAEPNSVHSKAVVASGDIGLQNGELMTEKEECKAVVDNWVENDALAMDSEDVSRNSGVAVLSHDLVIPSESNALVMCCDQKDLAIVNISNGSEASCSGSRRTPARKRSPRKRSDLDDNSLRSRSKWNWQPESDESKIKPEFNPQSIDEYLHATHPGCHLTNNVRKHLYHLGWKTEYTRIGVQIRFRYKSPDGKTFYNVRDVCKKLKSIAQNSCPTVEDAEESKRISSSSSDVKSLSLITEPHTSLVQTRKRKSRETFANPKDIFLPPEYCPESVDEYLETMKSIYSSRSMNHKKLIGKVRRHLSAIGWVFMQIAKKGRFKWHYGSPNTGKAYNSLRKACQAITKGEEPNTPAHRSMFIKESMDHSDGELLLLDADPQQDFFAQSSKKCSSLRKQRTEGIRKRHKRKNNDFVRDTPSPLVTTGQDQQHNGSTNGLKNGVKQCSIRKLSASFLSKKTEALGKVRSSSLNGNNVTRMLRSSKRVRQGGPSSFSQVSRTVLSWLIDNNVVTSRKKVYYRIGRDHPSIAEGKITREGIRCNCCQKIFTLSAFDAHAGSNGCQPAANLFLEDGRSLVDCQMEMIHKNSWIMSGEPLERACGNNSESWNDHICSICHYGGELILCDLCPSSFHKDCLNLQNIPDGDWFCPSCCCGICGESQFDVNSEQFTDKSILCCQQCERQYHAHCIRIREMIKLDAHPTEKWFCSKTCEKVHWGLQQLLGKPILVGHNNLTWTLIKPMHCKARELDDCDIVTMAENNSKLHVALEVMHECFEPVKEPQTRRDLVEDVIFGRSSELKRLNFRGFYTILLERNDELISVAILRVYGNKVAEIPLIGTRFQHRRLGMCRILMNEIEKNLIKLGVDRLVLPAAASVLNTWTSAFGFSPVTQSERSDFLGYTFLDFQDTVMCQKLLKKRPSALSNFLRDKPGVHCEPRQNIEGSNSVLDFEGNSGISEVFQEEQVEGSESVDQVAEVNESGDKRNANDDDCGLGHPVPMVTDQPTNKESKACSTVESTGEKKVDKDRENGDGNLKFYKRKKAVELRHSIPHQADYPKVEVSCR